MLSNLINNYQFIHMIGLIFAFVATFICTKMLKKYLPLDQGKVLAVDSMKSAGKPEGAGIIFVLVFIIAGFLFGTVSVENSIYLVIIGICMLTGYLDDCAKIPWHEYFKGALDLVVAAMVAFTYIYFNGTEVVLRIIDIKLNFNPVLLGFIIVCLVWCSINVTNCSDGVDGLSASLTISTLSAFYLTANESMKNAGYDYFILLFVVCLLAYLWFNANPSILLM